MLFFFSSLEPLFHVPSVVFEHGNQFQLNF